MSAYVSEGDTKMQVIVLWLYESSELLVSKQVLLCWNS